MFKIKIPQDENKEITYSVFDEKEYIIVLSGINSSLFFSTKYYDIEGVSPLTFRNNVPVMVDSEDIIAFNQDIHSTFRSDNVTIPFGHAISKTDFDKLKMNAEMFNLEINQDFFEQEKNFEQDLDSAKTMVKKISK